MLAQRPFGGGYSRASRALPRAQVAALVPSTVLFDVGVNPDTRTFGIIAALSALAKTTVKTHLTNVFKKPGVSRRLQLGLAIGPERVQTRVVETSDGLLDGRR
jgi:hypothetical protein